MRALLALRERSAKIAAAYSEPGDRRLTPFFAAGEDRTWVLVKVKKTAGVAYPCTFVYSIYESDADVTTATALATNLTPYFAGLRSQFSIAPPADGSYGFAGYVNGAWVLWQVAETISGKRNC